MNMMNDEMAAADNNSELESQAAQSTHVTTSSIVTDPCGSDASDAHSAYTASLVQSAAKSILEGNTSLVSDDASDSDNTAEESGEEKQPAVFTKLPIPSPQHIASLESLKTETIPAMPNEQDRRRFLGCLAAVLASMYDYDCSDPKEANEDDFNADLLEMFSREEEELFASSSDLPDSSPAPQSAPNSDTNEQPEPPSSSTHSQDSGDSWEGDDNDDDDDLSTKPPSSESQKQSKAESGGMSQQFFQRDKQKMSIKRHRRRRYQVLSRLLINASEFLKLDRAQAKAFLPLLARLLKPPVEGAKDQTLSILQPFLESLSPGSGFRCLSLLLVEHLLRSEDGYDARARYIYKTLGTVLICHQWDKLDRHSDPSMARAARKFEALEHGIAEKILLLSGTGKRRRALTKEKRSSFGKEQILRGLKIGSAGVVAGTILAVTGGITAPAIAMSLSTFVPAALASLTTTASITAIFGVSGAGLAAYKMHRRSRGLTEFEFQKETGSDEKIEAELFTTICISGWLRDDCDFQRPWGVTPTKPPIKDLVERLERFYAIHKPENLVRCSRIIASWKGEEDKLWSVIRQKYGRDPDHVFPLNDGPRHDAALTLQQEEIIHGLFVELGYIEEEPEKKKPSAIDKLKSTWKRRFHAEEEAEARVPISAPFDDPSFSSPSNRSAAFTDYQKESHRGSMHESEEKNGTKKNLPDHLRTVWDYKATYGGELYTVRFESDMLIELCNSVEDVVMEGLSNATQQILKQTVFAAVLSAAAIPVALIRSANMIDSTWTLAVERADEAGRDLASCLLGSQAGRRPITLVGFSMGARAIYSCLKELAREQEKWEEAREAQAQGLKPKGKKKDYTEVLKRREPASIIEDVIIMGLPNHLSLRSWQAARRIVAGRIVNCYSRKDMILNLMFQYKRMAFKPVCGTCAIDVPGIENIEVTDLVSSHSQYCIRAGDILARARHGEPTRGPGNLPLRSKAGSSEGDEKKESHDNE